MQKFINYLKSITPLTEQQEADVKAELERLIKLSERKQLYKDFDSTKSMYDDVMSIIDQSIKELENE